MKTILAIINDPTVPKFKKKIAFMKWKFNQMPRWYRESHRDEYLNDIENIRKEAYGEM